MDTGTDARKRMGCGSVVELSTDFLEGALDEPLRAGFEDHLRSCRACSIYVRQIRVSLKIARGLRDESVPPDARARSLETFRRWKRENTPREPGPAN